MALPIDSRSADTDLLEIWLYVAQRSLTAADRTVARLRERCEMLANNRGDGELRPQIGPSTRVFSAGEYVLFFRPHADSIGFMRIVHGGRDWTSFDWDVL